MQERGQRWGVILAATCGAEMTQDVEQIMTMCVATTSRLKCSEVVARKAGSSNICARHGGRGEGALGTSARIECLVSKA